MEPRHSLNELVRRYALELPAGFEAELFRLLGATTVSEPSATWSDADEHGDARALAGLDGPSQRYDDRGPIGEGGMGEIRRVWDRVLGRTVAMKVLRRASPAGLQRFRREVRATARLQHPCIPPVHDAGVLPDGRLWFTMKKIEGRTLEDVVSDGRGPSGEPWGLRRLIETLTRACQAVAFAHQQDILHRDLKPSNLMVGAFGEVFVLDWGLTGAGAVLGDDDGDEDDEDSALTRVGAVLGTPAFMSPEQARGEVATPASDVYGLGAILYVLLTGQAPYRAETGARVVGLVREGAPAPMLGVDPELKRVCERAMNRSPEHRHASADALASDLQGWLDGARRREEADGLLAQSRAIEPDVAALRSRAHTATQEAARVLDAVPSHAPVERKRPGWELEDAAVALWIASDEREGELQRFLEAAFVRDPESPSVHAHLAERHRDQLEAATLARDQRSMRRAEASMRAEVAALPSSDPKRDRLERWLVGDGRLSLHVDAPDATVLVSRYVERGRRLVAEPFDTLRAPIVDHALPMGSYLLTLEAPGRHPVRYPVLIEREGVWDAVPPGASQPQAVHLPPIGALAPNERFVAGGWFWSGEHSADRRDPRVLQRRRVWLDDFVIERTAVTMERYLSFVNDVVDRGNRVAASRFVPGEYGLAPDTPGQCFCELDEAGHYQRVADRVGQMMEADHPAYAMDWYSVVHFLRWFSARTGQAWRLPMELEFEKAARGVDGRSYPWGSYGEPTWAATSGARDGDPLVWSVGTSPVDTSPYDVADLAGNIMAWCGDVWTPTGPTVDGGRVVDSGPVDLDPDDPRSRVTRGGAWLHPVSNSACSARRRAEVSWRGAALGIRLVRPYLT